MLPIVLDTKSMCVAEQVAAWREWFSPIFDISPRGSESGWFWAENKVWDIGGILLSGARAPATRVTRGKLNISRFPVDHWVLTCNLRGETAITTDSSTLRASAGDTFLWSLGDRTQSDRSAVERIQLLMPRDMFRDIAPLMDASRGAVLDTPLGRMLGDYLIFLEQRLDSIAANELPHLTDAVRSMVAACLAPSADRIAVAATEIDHGRRERVCRVIHAQLRSPALAPVAICRAVGLSRSQLYRLFEHLGGVSRYIQRQRLLQSYALLCDPLNNQSVAAIAEDFCFEDASSFSRAFRREFSHSPSDVRAAAAAGIPITARRRVQDVSESQRFGDLLNAARQAPPGGFAAKSPSAT
jgi:AraC-like DNA-binding protein